MGNISYEDFANDVYFEDVNDYGGILVHVVMVVVAVVVEVTMLPT